LHYVTCGEGPPVLLIHGLGDRHTVWRAVMPALVAKGHQVIAIDLPGHGLSGGREWTIDDTIRRIIVTLESLGLRRVHVVGNSFGGYLALRMAADGHGLSVTALAPAGFASAPHLVLAGGRLFRNRLADALKRGTRRSSKTGVTRVGRLAVGARSQPSWTGFVRYLLPGLVARLRFGIEIPATIAWGDADPILDTRGIRRASLRDATIHWVEIPGCGHFPMKDEPDVTASLILETAKQ
jgi:pimeloyl-ACP methyl ester carboxylesterase